MENIILGKLLIASTNPGKLREIQSIFIDNPPEKGEVWLLSPAELKILLDIDENGETYADNAALKAVAYCQASGLITLADNSGLEVDALEGAPGVHSHRISPDPNATDADRRGLLLQRLQNVPRPWLARFRCTVAISTPEGGLFYSGGQVRGEIIPEERGAHGFGYDPIFLLPELGRTMAELTMEEKNHLSHRARAIRSALPGLYALYE